MSVGSTLRNEKAERLEVFAGFGFNGYRSFGAVSGVQTVGPMAKVHLLVGKNNSGKSNVLRFVKEAFPHITLDENAAPFSEIFPDLLDINRGWEDPGWIDFRVGLYLDKLIRFLAYEDIPLNHTRELLNAPPFTTSGESGVLWLDFALSNRDDPTFTGAFDINVELLKELAQQVDEQVLTRASEEFGAYKQSHPQIKLAQIFRGLNVLQFLPSVEAVDAVRAIRVGKPNELGSSEGLITRLARLQNPEIENYHDDREAYRRFETFVQTVLEDEAVRVVIPASQKEILIENEQGVFPLDRVGTGTSDLIILAANATLHQHKLLCIDEPEIHLHPTLQRKLLNYLEKETSNKYLLATHSAVFLNSGSVSISHVRFEDGTSKITKATTKSELSRVVSDLGNRASDLFQSNYIIWVEGPSDRIYIRRWISLFDDALLENSHYVIMFYGGVLLKYLSAMGDVAVEGAADLIRLFEINPNFAIVIDSDRRDKKERIKGVKRRVRADAAKMRNYSWVTSGYTIENYIAPDLLQKAITAVHPEKGKEYEIPNSQFQSPFSGKIGNKSIKFSKVDIAREVAARMETIPDEVRPHIAQITRRIRAANGMPTA